VGEQHGRAHEFRNMSSRRDVLTLQRVVDLHLSKFEVDVSIKATADDMQAHD
jgi:hypothetical protein